MPWFVRPYKVAFVLAFYALAPGALVQILKSLFGRPRPRHIVDFGGDLFFTPVLSFDGGCLRNCSFPSGESASATALLAFVVLVPKQFRRTCVAILLPFIVLFSLNRVAMGAHFLSDVMIAWSLMLAVMFPTFGLFRRYRAAIDAAVMRKGRLRTSHPTVEANS
ncbi:phosphatase PAP2 family protein [Rhizobium sp. Root1203]|uniref:phosphatase PAP2 family protein n=1 Tax=Rhizobium sp. Root1203 TaxID=1736427 RepID=UPI003FD451C8